MRSFNALTQTPESPSAILRLAPFGQMADHALVRANSRHMYTDV